VIYAENYQLEACLKTGWKIKSAVKRYRCT